MPVLSKQDVWSRLRANSGRLRALGVRRCGLFGSFARDEARADSDVDLLVEFEREQKTFDRFMELGFLLEELLERRVEIVTPESLSPHLGPHILREVQYAALDG